MSSAYRIAPAAALGALVRLHRDDGGRMLLGCLTFVGVSAGLTFAVIGNWLGLVVDVVGIGAGVYVLRRRGGSDGHIAQHEHGLAQTASGTSRRRSSSTRSHRSRAIAR